MPVPRNQSFNSVQSTINNPIPQQFGTQEIFRFRPGLVTQLQKGNAFDFNNSRWFSIGSLSTGSQNVYGLRFQLENKAITMGYQDLGDTNPRIQWIGAGAASTSSLEFRAANSFTSTNSTLVATMTNDGRTYFGDPLAAFDTKVSIDYTEVSGASSRVGLTLETDASQNGVFTTAIRSVNNAGGFIKTGLDIESTTGSSFENTGINVRVNKGTQNTGVRAFATDNGSDGPTYGIFGSVASTADVRVPAFGAAIYGTSSTESNRFAGYFNGNAVVTGSFSSGSDRKLKQDIKVEDKMLEKLAQIDAVNYTFKPNDQLNLPANLQHGFIAQNIEEVFPELVTTINKPILDKDNKQLGVYEYKAVNYIGLISILASSLQELNETSTARIDELDAQNEASTERINELNERINALETKLGTQNDTSDLGFSMEQNKPNPFTNQTVINYTLPKNTSATISVVDLSGKLIRDYNLSSEKGQLTINSSEIGKGIFVYALISDNEVVITKKMIVR
ncbi:MAG: tail fiber domain-containing protein [Kordia sp.]|uniref:tail fiber domain-containing protein n=1 Tax=Kordia sp. TaxID=1965332 RepID=UPI00385F45F3